MRKSQSADADKKETVSSHTKKLVATKYEGSEDPTLLHQPSDKETPMLKVKVLQNVSQNFYTPKASLCRFLVNRPVWGISLKSCMWATVHLRRDEDKFQRIIQNLEVQRIQTVFETVTVQISNLRLRDREIYGLSKNVDLADGCCRTYSPLDGRISKRTKSKVCVFSDSIRFCVLVESAPNIQMLQNIEKSKASHISSKVRSIVNSTTSRVSLWNSYTRDACRRGRVAVSVQRQGHFRVHVVVNWWQNQNEHVCRQNTILVALFAKDIEPGRWSFLGPGNGERWYGSLIEKPMGNGTLQRRL